MRIGIVGAGKLGTVLGRRAVAAGHEVVIAGRPGAFQTELVVEVMVPGATTSPVADWGAVDLAILAVPFSTALTIDLPLPEGTVVIDPTNHWEPVDGPRPDLGGLSTSEATAAAHPGLRWVKSLNQLGYHDLEDDTILSGPTPTIGIAADSADAARIAAEFIASLDLDPVHIGPLSAGRDLEPGSDRFDAAIAALIGQGMANSA